MNRVVYRIMVDKKEVGFTFNYSTAIWKKRELQSQGKKVRIVEEIF